MNRFFHSAGFLLLTVLFPFCVSASSGNADALRASAESGDPVAQFKLGLEYFRGTAGRGQNPDLAAYWFGQAAGKGLPQAQLNYAVCLENGFGITRDPKKALDWYARAAEQDVIPARLGMALLLLNGAENGLADDRKVRPDPEQAVKLLRALADRKCAPAMVELAAFLVRGDKPADDARKKSFDLLHAASLLPDVPAKGLRMLAECCAAGSGCAQDKPRALELFRRAARMNDTDAIAGLASFYERGEAVPKDAARAMRLYKRAALAGHPLAEYKYAEAVYAGMEKDTDPKEALGWLRKSADRGCPQALHRLAEFSAAGMETGKPDKIRAAELYLEAAKRGYAQSQYALGCMLFAGDGISQDEARAFYWFAQAALRDYPPAMRRVAQCYYDGRGCEKDNEKAVGWLKAAAEAGDYTALQMLESNSRNAW